MSLGSVPELDRWPDRRERERGKPFPSLLESLLSRQSHGAAAATNLLMGGPNSPAGVCLNEADDATQRRLASEKSH